MLPARPARDEAPAPPFFVDATPLVPGSTNAWKSFPVHGLNHWFKQVDAGFQIDHDGNMDVSVANMFSSAGRRIANQKSFKANDPRKTAPDICGSHGSERPTKPGTVRLLKDIAGATGETAAPALEK